jgi:hypothetical protein
MAALTSSQSGNWTSSSTWGGSTPSDGDTFTIAAGHKVTVNSDNRPTNGYGDITVHGNLHFASTAKFRMNGRITVHGDNALDYNNNLQFVDGNSGTGALLSATGNDIILEFRGSNDDQHGIWVENLRFSSLKLVGDESRTFSTLSSAVEINADYLPVSSTSGFAAGDWISVFLDGNQDARANADEGFWVHDVDTTNNRIYYRQYVSPTATILRSNSNKLFVDNARVFRVGYKIIFGTGTNRNVRTITGINFKNNKITLNSSVTGNVIEEKIYQTGAEKKHLSGDTVLKMATTLTTAVTANTTNQITVASSSDINVGDFIVVDVNNDNDFGWDYRAHYTVTGKSGNTLTLDTNLEHNRKVGSLVTVLTRDIKIKGVDTDGGTRCFLYVEYWTDGNATRTRQIHLKNIEFLQWGNNRKSTWYRSVFIGGYNSYYKDDDSTDGRFGFQSRMEGCTIHSTNTVNQDYTGLNVRHTYYFTMRNNISYYSSARLFWHWSSNHNLKFMNNYASRASYSCLLNDSVYEPYSEHSYNYFTRSDDYGMMFHHHRDPNPIRHNILLNHEQRPFYCYYTVNGNEFNRMYIDGYRTLPHIGERNGEVIFTDSYIGNRWFKSLDGNTNGLLESSKYLSYDGKNGTTQYLRTSGKTQYQRYEDSQFESGKTFELWGNGGVLTDRVNNTSKMYTLGGDGYTVYASSIYVPANTTVRLACKLRGENNTSYSFPFLFARKQMNGHNSGRFQTGYTSQTSYKDSSDTEVQNSRHLGFMERQQFSSSMRGSYEEVQLTIQPMNYSFLMVFGIDVDDNMREEVVDFSGIDIMFDKAPKGRNIALSGERVKIRNSFTQQKKRISGRL